MSTSTIKRLWYRWKALKLPWRRKFLVGFDLSGHTYWEFKDALNSNRMRRIVHYPRSTHYGDVNMTPQWHQWLRYTRPDPPSLQEQRADLDRQASMKELARLADERWASKPSFLSTPPEQQQPAPAIGVRDPGGYTAPTWEEGKKGVRSAVESGEDVTKEAAPTKKDKDPWEKAQSASGSSEPWQPQSWDPSRAPARR
ncbi:MAG: hypothetical protein M1833_001623 [Piccolia ochrophora]|nr:MAG: hypothetical protein M1833_001623 [Piccolia ochrophora]